ncbi:hypothetical protein [Brachyspira aalborgi]|uniref:Cell wall-active antibiotics response LiaF-like C-terminal domain-containing protein n=1 Tax=Brachyspira aalborgi TaxID=29522 RepID=A0A5C8EQG8_9SPIR|nr:hypothetical protein [Brachyspira aalborgi]TXJ39573.1 hypothetical protein EPJ78_00670 [Brachyspira aalborgi]
MRFLSSGIFWGFIVILFGVGILLKSVFHVNIPFFKILIGIIVILFGVSIIFNAINSRRNNTVFREYNFNFGTIEKEYNIVFSKGVFDFTNFNFSNYNGEFIKINSAFSKSEIYLSRNFEYEIRADSVFGVVSLPNGESVSFGNIARLENAENSGLKRINLHVSSVFGETKILYK